MTRSLNGPHDAREIWDSCPAGSDGPSRAPGMSVPVQDEPLTRERVVTEIVQAVRTIHTSFPLHRLNADTNLALDLGLESASRVDLLLEVERALDAALDIGVMAVFAELTIGQLADLIVMLPEGQDRAMADHLP